MTAQIDPSDTARSGDPSALRWPGLAVAGALVPRHRRLGFRTLAFAVPAFLAGFACGISYSDLSRVSGAACRGDAKPLARLELLFGMKRRDGRAISESEWTSFLDTQVTPRFPLGLTVLAGPGQWQAFDGHLEREGSKLLVIWHSKSARSEADIEQIRAAYKLHFDQDSVLRVESISCVSF